MLQCVVVCCSAVGVYRTLQCVAVYSVSCSVLQCSGCLVCCNTLRCLQCVAVCCKFCGAVGVYCVAVCCNVLQFGGCLVCCSVLQYLQCVAVCWVCFSLQRPDVCNSCISRYPRV